MVYPNGATKIIDRSKNIFKLSQGEYIAPEKIENVFGLSPWIAQSWVTGDSMKNNTVAVIVPNPDALKKWASQHGKLLIYTVIPVFRLKRDYRATLPKQGGKSGDHGRDC